MFRFLGYEQQRPYYIPSLCKQLLSKRVFRLRWKSEFNIRRSTVFVCLFVFHFDYLFSFSMKFNISWSLYKKKDKRNKKIRINQIKKGVNILKFHRLMITKMWSRSTHASNTGMPYTYKHEQEHTNNQQTRNKEVDPLVRRRKGVRRSHPQDFFFPGRGTLWLQPRLFFKDRMPWLGP